MIETNHNFSFSRRSLIKYGGGFLGTGLAATVLGNNLITPEPVVAQNKNVTPDEALKKLIEGNQRFVSQKRTNPNQNMKRLTEVAESQAPFAAILGCADSRVPSEIIFDQGLGDIFVCRVAGNIATSEEIGSLEFGTLVLGAKIILVLGHERCGAVKAAIKGGDLPGSIGSLVADIKVGIEGVKKMPEATQLDRSIKANINYQVKKLNQSPVLSDLINKNQLKIVGGYYDLDTGKVEIVV